MPASRTRVSPELLLPIVSAALLGVYLLTLSRVHGWDAMAYAARAASDPFLSERYLSTRLFHPHHLFYVPLAMVASLPFKVFTDDPLLPLQALNALMGAGSAFLSGLLARRMGAGPLVAAATAVAAGLSGAVWRYSTEAEVMVPCLFFLLLGTWLADRARSSGAWALAGLALSLAILLHQIAVLYAAAATAIVFVREAGTDRRKAARFSTAFLSGWALPALVAYLAVGILSVRPQAVTDLFDWMTVARSRSTFAFRSSGSAVVDAARSIAGSWVTLAPLSGQREVSGSFLPALQVAVGTAMIGGLWILARSLPGIFRAVRAGNLPARMMMAGGGSMALFIAWFQPWNPDYWVYFPPIASAMAGAFVPGDAHRLRRIAYLTFPALVLANLFGQALPLRDPGRASYAEILEFAERHLRRGDVLLSGGVESAVGDGIVALPLLAGVQVLPVAESPPPPEFDTELDERARAAWEGGSKVFALGDGVNAARSRWPSAAVRPTGRFRDEALVEIGAPSGRP